MTLPKLPKDAALQPPPLDKSSQKLPGSRSKLDDSVIEAIADGLAKGLSKSDAAASVGVSPQLLNSWLTQGKDLLEKNKTSSVYARLVVECQRAEAHYRAWLCQLGNESAAGNKLINHKYIAWRLGVSDRSEFQVQPGSSQDQAQNPEDQVQMLAGPELAASLESKLSRFLAAQEPAPAPVEAKGDE